MVPFIEEIAKGLISPISDILKEVVTDKDERNRLAHDIALTTATHAHEQTLAQIEVNNTQAKHSPLFVSGARPAVMWICALSLFYSGFVYKVADIWVEMPPPDNELLIYILGGLLGLKVSDGCLLTTKNIGVDCWRGACRRLRIATTEQRAGWTITRKDCPHRSA
jgi:hypothetical protein